MLQISVNQAASTKIENDFDNPLGLLSDCHRRIEKFLEQIIRVCETARGGALNDNQREALQVALRYFRQAAPLHTADEENSLFPRLRERAENGDSKAQSALAVSALAVIERLEADHDAADERHAVIDELGLRWLENNALSAQDATELEGETRNLRAFYAAHIAVEDNELFPLAGKVLADDTTETIGREMASRRGLDFDNLPAGSRCAARRAVANNGARTS
jgi:hemerythrin-like domain-containing protein